MDALRRALVLGRFQPPHNGHLDVLAWAASRYDEVIVLVGSAQESGTWQNPFAAADRIALLQEAAARVGIPNLVFQAIDDLNDHDAWVAFVDRQVPKYSEVVTVNPVTRRLFAAAGYPVATGPVKDRSRDQGSKIRLRIAAGESVADLVPPNVDGWLGRTDARGLLVRLAGEGRDA